MNQAIDRALGHVLALPLRRRAAVLLTLGALLYLVCGTAATLTEHAFNDGFPLALAAACAVGLAARRRHDRLCDDEDPT